MLHDVVSRLERLPEEQRAMAAGVIQRELDRLQDGDRRDAPGWVASNQPVRGTLRASEAQLRLIVRRMPAILWTIDTQMTFTSSMGAGLTLLGLEPDEVVGMSLHDFLGTDDPESPSIRAHLRALAGEAVSYESEVAGHAFETAVEPLLDQGRIVGAIGVAVDTTERRQAEEARRWEAERYRSLVAATAQLVWTADAAGRITSDLAAWSAYTGQSEQDVRGSGWLYAIHPDDRERAKAAWANADTTRETYETTYRVRRHDGVYRHLLERGVPILEPDGTVREWVGTCTDITERVQAYELMEERVRERTRELSTLLEVAHKVASTLELEPLLGVILDQIRRVVDFTGASILVVEGDYLRTAAYRGPMSQEQASQLRFSLVRAGVNWQTVKDQQPVIIDDVYGVDVAARAFRDMVGEHLHGDLAYIRSHMGIPLILKDRMIGQLTLSHSEPNHYTRHHADLATAIASQAAVAIENAQLYKRAGELAALEERGRLARELLEKERLEGELEVAHRIQKALLPRELPEIQGWKLAVHYRSARAVGGDFYDFYNLPDGRLGMVIGDVAGMGVPASLMMATAHSILRGAAQMSSSPGHALTRANDLLYRDMPANMFVTCFYASLDPKTGQLQYANAGHNLPYRARAGVVDELRARGMPLGLMPQMQYEERTMLLEPEDTVLLYTDGLVEAHDSRRRLYGGLRVRELMRDHRSNGERELIDSLLSDLGRFTGLSWEQEDDLTLVTIQWRRSGDDVS